MKKYFIMVGLLSGLSSLSATAEENLKVAGFPEVSGFSEVALLPESAAGLFRAGPASYYWGQLQMDQAWGITHGNPSVKVAVLTTGAQYNLMELRNSIALNSGELGEGRETDGLDNDENGYVDDVFGANSLTQTGDPTDSHGIGTFEASLISSPRFGLAPGAQVIPVAICDGNGACTRDSVIRGIRYAVSRGASLIYLGVGGIYPDAGTAKAQCEAIAEAGVPVIAPAGSEAVDLDQSAEFHFAPDCGASNLLIVAATDEVSGLARFSNYGARKVDVAAPGVNIPGLSLTGQQTQYSGGSVAGVITAAVASLVLSAHPDYSALELKRALIAGLDPQESLKGKVSSGGRLNAYKALTAQVK